MSDDELKSILQTTNRSELRVGDRVTPVPRDEVHNVEAGPCYTQTMVRHAGDVYEVTGISMEYTDEPHYTLSNGYSYLGEWLVDA